MTNNANQIEVLKNVFKVDFKKLDISLNINKIAISIGYKDGQLPAHFEEMISNILNKLNDNIVLQAGYTIKELSYSKEFPNALIIDGEKFITDRIVASQIKKSSYIALFICSIGSQMEEWSKQETKLGDMVSSYLIDTVASEAVEALADLLHDHIKLIANQNNWNITNRYSPGYCNWSVSDQHKLFKFFPDNFCGVKLTASSLMLPVKSISGIIGLGKDVRYNEYLCDRCGIQDCTHRIYLMNKELIKSKKSKKIEGIK